MGGRASGSWPPVSMRKTTSGSRVLALIHERPAEPWTLQALAGEVHLSRATLARCFAEAVGEPPLAYLSRWRMHLAADRLTHTTDTIETVARTVGYSSEYSFNRGTADSRQAGTAGSGAQPESELARRATGMTRPLAASGLR